MLPRVYKKTNLKKIATVFAGVFFVAVFLLLAQSALAQVASQPDLNFGLQPVEQNIGLGGEDIRLIIARIIRAVLGLLGIIAICLMLWAGYTIMTAGGNEEKIQEGEKFIVIRQAKLKGAKKINPFNLRVEISDSKISFIYAGEQGEALDAVTKLRNELYEIIQKTEFWMGIKDFHEQVNKSETLIRLQIKALVDGKYIQSKVKAVLVREGSPVSKRTDIGTQSTLYFRVDDINKNILDF